MPIENEEQLAEVFVDAADMIVVRTALNDLLLLWENEDGRVAYQGFPQAEDEDGDKVDQNSGWLDRLTSMIWPLTYLGGADPDADGRVSGKRFSSYEAGGPFVIEYESRSDGGPMLVGPFGSRQAAVGHADELAYPGFDASYGITRVAGAHESLEARKAGE